MRIGNLNFAKKNKIDYFVSAFGFQSAFLLTVPVLLFKQITLFCMKEQNKAVHFGFVLDPVFRILHITEYTNHFD